MSLTIIIPTFNEALGIEKCLLALQSLRQQGCQIIVADGGSIDETMALAKPLADLIISTDKGRAKQMNTGAKLANNDILLFLHADTFLPENTFELITKSLTSEYHWGRFDMYLSGSHPMFIIIALMMNWRSRLTGIATGDQAIFVKKLNFEIIQGYPDIALMEDISLCQQLKKFSAPICLKAKVSSSSRRWQDNGVVKTMLLMWWLRAGFYFGITSDTLAKLYYRGHFWKH